MAAKNLKKLFRPEILKKKAYQLKSYPQAIKLDQNELPFAFPAELKKALLQAFQKLKLPRYPQTQPWELRRRLACHLQLEPEQILLANGSNVLIQAIITATSLGSSVLALRPSFSLYEDQSQLLGTQLQTVNLNRKDFSLPVEKILDQFKKHRPSLVFLANPNAPTGNLFTESDLLKVIEAAPGMVVVDEAYYQFSGFTLQKQLKKYPHLVLLRTFSKGFGLGGARIGYLLAHPQVVEQFQKILLPYCVSSLSEKAALVILDHLDFFETAVAKVQKQRNFLFQEMKAIPKVQTYSSDANYFLFQVSDSAQCFQFLLDRGILVRDISSYPLLKNCLRVSVGLPRENRLFLEALRAYAEGA